MLRSAIPRGSICLTVLLTVQAIYTVHVPKTSHGSTMRWFGNTTMVLSNGCRAVVLLLSISDVACRVNGFDNGQCFSINKQ